MVGFFAGIGERSRRWWSSGIKLTSEWGCGAGCPGPFLIHSRGISC